MLGRRSIEDEKLLQLIFLNCVQDQSELLDKSTTSLSSLLNDEKSSLDKLTPANNKLSTACACDCDSNNQKQALETNGNCNKLNGNLNNNQDQDKEEENSSSLNNEEEKYCNCKCHNQETSFVINQNCQQPTQQSSKFFSLSDKILENIMSYTSYTDNQTSSNKKLLILDARSFTVAFLNRAFGGGSECSEYYPNSEVDFLYLANIHAVRTAFFSLKTLIRSDQMNRTDNNQY